jgi:hypothetical protein
LLIINLKYFLKIIDFILSMFKICNVRLYALNNLYSSLNIVRVIKSRRMRWAGHVARMGEGRGLYRVLVGRPEGRRPLRRPRRRWEDNIRMDLREVGCGKIKKNEMGGACSSYGGGEMCVQGFGGET